MLSSGPGNGAKFFLFVVASVLLGKSVLRLRITLNLAGDCSGLFLLLFPVTIILAVFGQLNGIIRQRFIIGRADFVHLFIVIKHLIRIPA